jgi:hypothetical protein
LRASSDALMVVVGIAAVAARSDGLPMRRVIVIAVAGFSLAGCGSLSWDAFKSTPPIVQVRLESVPPGADALTSLGPGCKTPCSVGIAASDSSFSVTYTMNRFQPVTMPVQVTQIPGDLTTSGSTRIDPNPVVAQLQPSGPPPKPARKVHRPSKPKPPKGAAAAPAAAGSAFRDPAQAPAAAAPPPAPAAAPPAPQTAR